MKIGLVSLTISLLTLSLSLALADTPPTTEKDKTESTQVLQPGNTDKSEVKPAKTEEAKSEEPKETKEEAAQKAAVERARRAAARAKGDLTFDDLKFDIEKDGDFKRSMLTKDIEELDKKNIRIRGFILPQSVFKSPFDKFVLVRDNQECCFGPGAALYDCIIVQMENGKKAEFSTRPVSVKGKFEIKEFKYPGTEKHYAIFQLTASEVK
jgi:hypothetical protein